MILQALHTKLNPVLKAFPLIGDIEADPPFCIFNANPTPIRTKDGISEYEQQVNIKVLDWTAADVDTYTTGVRAAVEGITGTVDSTIFNNIMYIGESGIYYSEADGIYINDLEFKIHTQNR
jgi:hypothetical protein